MRTESFQHQEKAGAQAEEQDIEIQEKSKRLGFVLNKIRSVILSGGLTLTLGGGLGLGLGKIGVDYLETRNKTKVRAEMVEKTGEAGGTLFDMFGSAYQIDIDSRMKRAQALESREPMRIEPLNAREGAISAGMLKAITEKTYPKGWFQNHVADIKQSRDKKDFESTTIANNKEKLEILAVNKRGEEKRSSIIFNQEISQKESMQSLIQDTLSHESCHAAENRLPVTEANSLFKALAERIFADDRFQSEYVESIDVGNKKTSDFIKIQEYWAEICAQFFQDPTQLNVKDFRIVSEQIEKVDPKFNWKMANQKRRDIVYGKVKGYYAKRRS